jgi:hypothetical protein
MDSKLLRTCHAKGKMFQAAYNIRLILTKIVARPGVERGERNFVMHADNERPHPAKVT